MSKRILCLSHQPFWSNSYYHSFPKLNDINEQMNILLEFLFIDKPKLWFKQTFYNWFTKVTFFHQISINICHVNCGISYKRLKSKRFCAQKFKEVYTKYMNYPPLFDLTIWLKWRLLTKRQEVYRAIPPVPREFFHLYKC